MSKEISALLKDKGLLISFHIDRGYFENDIPGTVESLRCT
jgi:hypothetical protein